MDPWLVEELIFAGQAWLYRGKKTHIPPLDLNKVVEGVDALILSQASNLFPCPLCLAFCAGILDLVQQQHSPAVRKEWLLDIFPCQGSHQGDPSAYFPSTVARHLLWYMATFWCGMQELPDPAHVPTKRKASTACNKDVV